jgi:hypothetical protein
LLRAFESEDGDIAFRKRVKPTGLINRIVYQFTV